MLLYQLAPLMAMGTLHAQEIREIAGLTKNNQNRIVNQAANLQSDTKRSFCDIIAITEQFTKGGGTMLTALLCLVGALFGLLFVWYLILVIIENVGPFILSMILLFKWLFSAVIALICYPFRSKKDSSPA